MCAHGQTEDSLSIGPLFQRETSFDSSGAVGANLSWGRQVPLYKTYPGAVKTALAVPVSSEAALDDVVQQRESVRSFTDRPMSLGQLSRILLTACGLTHRRFGIDMRAAPSGGALYPVELYVVAHSVEGLGSGLYHYQVSDSSLELIREGEFDQAMYEACNSQECIGRSPLTLVMTSRFDRSTQKYADRGYRYVYVECGAICQNIYLQATALNLGTVAVGAFNDEALNDFLGIDGLQEGALLVMPVGTPAP